MEKYVRITKTVNDKGRFVKLSDIETPEGLNKLISEAPKADWYRSLYYYPEAAVTLFASNGSIAGYTGKVFTDKLTFDLDSENLEQSKQDTMELLFRLEKNGVNIEESAKIYFSGNKGFHIEIPVSASLEPDELKSICLNISEGLTTIDPVIYNTNRLFRLENTKHQKSSLYKIELEPSDLVELSIDQIKDRAKEPSNKPPYTAKAVTEVGFLDKFKKPLSYKPIKQIIMDADEQGIRGMDQVDFTSCPKNKPRCIHALESGVMVSGAGQRNAIFLRMAAYYRNQGYTKEVTHNILKAVARDNARLYPESEPYTKEELWNTVINGAYSSPSFKVMPGSYGADPQNEMLKMYCDAAGKFTNRPCPLHNHVQAEQNTIVQINDIAEGFKKYAEDINNNTVRTGLQFVDKHMNLTTGTTTLLVGCSGSGKTTLALNILENANQTQQPSVFFSMDMHKNLIFQKLGQKLTNYTGEEIRELFYKKDAKKVQQIRDAISERYGMTFFDFSKTLNLDQMRDRILDIEQKSGKKLKFTLVDYAGRISGPYSDKYANASYNALKSVEVAEVTDTAMIIISQISRTTGSECTPIRTKRAAKESGDWEESATNVITMWRPFYGAEERDDVVRMYLAKNRMGPEPEQILSFDGSKGIIRDMTPSELADYGANRGDKAEREYLKQRLNRS